MIEITAIWLFADPFSDSIEHVPMNLEVLVAEGRVMENTYDIIHHLIGRYSRVLPSIENTTTAELVWFDLKYENFAYGVTYCKMVDATLPATGFNLFEK
jgi:hypothetical protein